MRRTHRILGPVLALPLVLWMVTGLLFHVKHRYAEAYEPIAVPPGGSVDWTTAGLAPAEVLSRGLADAPLHLAPHPSGRLAYFGASRGNPIAIDAASALPIAPATPQQARLWAAAAIASSAHALRYGELRDAREAKHRSSRTGLENPALAFDTSHGKTVTVDLVTGEISQTGALNDFIDATYRIHYLQWTPWKPANVALVLIAIPLVLGLALTGLRMSFGVSSSKP